MKYKISVDTGGTFTDVVVHDDDGGVVLGKSPTTPDRIFDGIISRSTELFGRLCKGFSSQLTTQG